MNIIFFIIWGRKYKQEIMGCGALSGKMLLVRIVENNKIDD